MDREIFHKIIDYPYICKNEFYDSTKLQQHKSCLKKCKERDCLSMFSDEFTNFHYRCKMGFDNFILNLNDNKFIVNGLILSDNRTIPNGRKDSRKEYIISKLEVDKHLESLKELDEIICQKIFKNIEENISVLHDVKTTIGIVTSCAEVIINSNQGKDFHEKLSNSSIDLRDLYDAVDLVNNQLGMIDILVNNQSITYGNRYSINIYQLFHRVAKLFRHRADKKDISIQWKDNGQVPNVKCYESIGFVPLILLDNAIKYSEPESKILTYFNVDLKKVNVVVSSFGPIVKKEYRNLIFEKYERGENAKKYSKDGIGVGLWIGKKILQAHNSDIAYDYEHVRDGLGFNKFIFEITFNEQ